MRWDTPGPNAQTEMGIALYFEGLFINQHKF